MVLGGVGVALCLFLATLHATTKRTILIIDDDRVIRGMLNRLLKRQYDVVIAETAEEGFEIASSRIFDLIISDHDTGSEMTGLQAIIQLRSNGYSKPIILFSSTYEALEQVKQYNAVQLEKPANTQTILDLVASTID